ncbi:hypothetical protein [Brevibacillus gelatini]|nr:hypothetical protein [Brevibacillus gelatini]
MKKKVKIINSSDMSMFSNINEYLLHTYGEKKLEESKRNSDPTFLDIIGYTLDGRRLETVEGAYYELDEIEDLMYYSPFEEESEEENDEHDEELEG